MTASTSHNRARNTVGQAPGIAGSLALHVAIVGAVLFAWMQSRDRPPDVPSTVIPVEMVDVADVTNIRPESREPQKPPEALLEDVTPTPAVQIPQEAPPPPEEAPPPEPQQTAEADEPAPPPPPPPLHKPHPAQPKPQTWDPSHIEALLDRTTPHSAPAAAAPRGQHNQRGIGDMNAATADIQAAFLQQMRECWNFPAGAPDPDELVVEMDIRLSRDGHLVGQPELSAFTRAAMARNRYMQAAGDAALRAVHVCEPYHLPADRYDQWRELTLIFDPTKMVGR